MPATIELLFVCYKGHKSGLFEDPVSGPFTNLEKALNDRDTRNQSLSSGYGRYEVRSFAFSGEWYDDWSEEE